MVTRVEPSRENDHTVGTHLKANDAAIIVIQRIKNKVSVVSCIRCKEETKVHETTTIIIISGHDLALLEGMTSCL